MKKLILLIALLTCLILTVSASEVIDVKDYIKGKFPVIFNIYLSSLGELDQEEKEFINLLQNLPEDEQKNFAKEVYNNGFSKEILENCKESFIVKEEKPEPEIKEEIIDTGKWIYGKGTNPLNDKIVITFRLECEKNEIDNPIFLILKKEGKTTTICIDWGVEVRDVYEGMVSVRTRFGDKKARKSLNWHTSIVTFGDIVAEAIFGKQAWVGSPYTFYDGRKSKFISKLIDVDEFVAEVKGIYKTKLTAVFDARGLKDAVKQFNDILGWIK